MPTIVSFTYHIVDGKNPAQSSKLTLYTLDNLDNFTIDELNQIVQASLPIIRPLVKGGITGCRIGFDADLAALFTANPDWKIADPDSDVEEGAIFCFHTSNVRPVKLRVATFNEDFILANDAVDILDPDVLAFTTMLTTGLIAPAMEYTDSHGDTITGLDYALDDFKRRKYKNRK